MLDTDTEQAGAVDRIPRALASQADIRALAHSLAGAYPSRARSPQRIAEDKGMELSSRDPALRAALFRLVDVAPACRDSRDLARHLAALTDDVPHPPAPVGAAVRLAETPLGSRAVGRAAARAVNTMAHRFIIGETPQEAAPVLARLWNRGQAASIDLLGEATVTQEEADRYAQRCLDVLETLTAAAKRWPERPILERDGSGALPRVNLSVKLSALTPLVRPHAPELGREDAGRRLRVLLRRARDLGAHLHIDMESMDSRDMVLGLVLDMLAEDEFRGDLSAGLVLQAYLTDTADSVDEVLDWAGRFDRTHPLTIRLVKGAYWDHELVEAQQKGWRPPVFQLKADSDRNFEALTRRLLDARPAVRVAIASHNLRSISHAIAEHRARGRDDGDIELQVLRGLGDDLAHGLAAHDLRVRVYCPIGDLVAGMAYLVRRLLENSANDSFLAARASGRELDDLLVAP
jgi:RHH-type proline utilization regulon transcriptional repressor/proline dehydrogenase/delta 1-pyrroline-5-carboxylate dehydrogenase